MKNIPILTLIPRIWLLVLFALASNFASLTNYPVVAAHWEHATNEGWARGTDGIWHQTDEETWVNVPAKTLFELCGAALYIPAIMSLVVLCAIVCVHLFFRQTIDADTHGGKYLCDWGALTAEERVRYATITRIGFLLAGALIAAGIGK